ncbi:MAG: 50S ribosomal protein L10 [Candidatus Aenigmatarchaeota archaeon]
MVKQWKKDEVEELKDLIDNHEVVGILNMHKMPAAQLSEMRKEMKGDAEIRMSKKILMRFALEKSKKKSVKNLEEHMRGQPAFLLSDMNPFKLFKHIDKNKTPAPARAGDIAPDDIVVTEGSTGLPPGPAIGQLQDQGIPTSVKEGAINVDEDTVVAGEGDEITTELANLLNTLDMEPMRIGLDLVAAYEDGTVFTKSVLKIDEEEYMDKLTNCIKKSINLSINANYPTKETAELLIQKSFTEMRNLAFEADLNIPEVLEDRITDAERKKRILEDNYVNKS